MAARFEITDGTTTIELLYYRNRMGGFMLNDWEPDIPSYKDRGAYSDSPLFDGRYPLKTPSDNPIERLELRGVFSNASALFTAWRNLRELLEQAMNYWQSPFDNACVYLICQGTQESSPRYAAITGWDLSGLENMFAAPFLQRSGRLLIEDIDLLLEHEVWSNVVPNSVTTEIGVLASQEFDSIDYGKTSAVTGIKAIQVANHHTIANISTVVVYTDDTANYNHVSNTNSSLLIELIDPLSVTPSQDFTYFGSETSITDSGPFHSISYENIEPRYASLGAAWEYWNGISWTAMSTTQVSDPNSNFTTTGRHTITFHNLTGWTYNTVDGVEAWWVRINWSGSLVGAAPTLRYLYAITWPYVEIESDKVSGDLPSEVKIRHYDFATDQADAARTRVVNHLYVGRRDLARGASFTSRLNISDEQIPANITVGKDATAGAWVTDSLAPSHRCLEHTFAFANIWYNMATILFDSAIANQFYGKYGLFLRHAQTSGSKGDTLLRVYLAEGSSAKIGDVETSFTETALVSASDLPIINFGTMQIPTYQSPDSATSTFQLVVQGKSANVANKIRLYELALIPVDEWFCYTFAPNENQPFGIEEDTDENRNYLDIDATLAGREPYVTSLRQYSTDDLITRWVASTPDPPRIERGKTYRYWYLYGLQETSGTQIYGRTTALVNPRFWGRDRFSFVS